MNYTFFFHSNKLVWEISLDRIVQWLTRPPDTRKIPSSSLGMVISLFLRRNIAKNRLSIVLKEGDGNVRVRFTLCGVLLELRI